MVGIEAYPEDEGWPQLAGPRADVEALRGALIERGGFPPENIRTLFDEQATRAGMLAAFGAMVDEAGPEDVLLFYFAGHGSQVPDRDGDENDGWDETIVPFDAVGADDQANDLLDEEIGALIRRANEATRHVVLIFDCCSSGTNVRGTAEEETRRFVSYEARGLQGTRKVTVAPKREEGSGYFRENLSYVAMAACQSTQSAFEVKLEDKAGASESRGLFTMALVQELYEPSGETSYEHLMDRVRRRVQVKKPTQTPVIEGPLSRNVLFEREGHEWATSFAVVPRDGGYVIEAGLCHGLTPETVLSVYEWPVLTDSDTELRLGKVRVKEVGPTESKLIWFDGEPPVGEERWRSFELERGPDDLRLGVAIEVPDAAQAGYRELAEALADRVDQQPHLQHVPEHEAVFVVSLAETRKGKLWSVSTPMDTDLPLEATADSEPELTRLISSLERLGKAYRVRHGVRASKSNVLEVNTGIIVLNQETEELSKPQRDDAGVQVLREGDEIRCRLVNRSKEESIFVSLIIIAPDGEIHVEHCTKTREDAVPPNQSVATDKLRMTIPEGNEAFYTEGTQSFRWVVTTEWHDLRDLMQSAVTQHRKVRGGRADMNPIFSGAAAQPVNSWLTRTTEVRLLPAK